MTTSASAKIADIRASIPFINNQGHVRGIGTTEGAKRNTEPPNSLANASPKSLKSKK